MFTIFLQAVPAVTPEPSLGDWAEKGIAFLIAIVLLYFFLKFIDKLMNEVVKKLQDMSDKIVVMEGKIDAAAASAAATKIDLSSYRESSKDITNNIRNDIATAKTVAEKNTQLIAQTFESIEKAKDVATAAKGVAEKNSETLKTLDDGLDKALDGVTKIVHDVSGITDKFTTFFDTFLRMVERRDGK